MLQACVRSRRGSAPHAGSSVRHEAPRRTPRPRDRRQPDQRDRPRRRRGGRRVTTWSSTASRGRSSTISSRAGLEFVPARPLRYRPAPSRIAQLAALARQPPARPDPRVRVAAVPRRVLRRPPAARRAARLHRPVDVGLAAGAALGPADHGHRGARRRGAPEPSRARVGARAADRRRRATIPASTARPSAATHGRRRRTSRCSSPCRGSRSTSSSTRSSRRSTRPDVARRAAARCGCAIVGGGPAAAALEERAADGQPRATAARSCSFLGPMPTRGPRTRPPTSSSAWAAPRCARCRSAARSSCRARAASPSCSSRRRSPTSCEHGFWGIAPSTGGRSSSSPASSSALLADRAPPRRARPLGRQVVEERFSLRRALTRQLEIYDEVRGSGAARAPRCGRRRRPRAPARGPRARSADQARRARSEAALLSAARGPEEAIVHG